MDDNLVDRALGNDDGDEDRLPEHERDTDTTVGGGMMSTGVTASDRGTGELTGTAQGADPDEEAGDSPFADDVAGVTGGVTPGTPSGGPQPYVPAMVDEDDRDDGGGALPDA